jgi:nucleoside-diphosphate-sugar epimerase
MTTILVTGAAGFVGGHLIDALSRRVPDSTIVGLDREPTLPDAISVSCVTSAAHTCSAP